MIVLSPMSSKVALIAMLVQISACNANGNRRASDVKFSQGAGGVTHGHEKLTELAVKIANKALLPDNRDEVRDFISLPQMERHPNTIDYFYPEDELNQAGWRNSNPLAWGSLSADMPDTARGVRVITALFDPERDKTDEKITKLNFLLCAHYDLIDKSAKNIDDAVRAKLSQCDKMPYSGRFQDVHFLRVWPDTKKADGVSNQPRKSKINLSTAQETCNLSQNRIRKATFDALTAWENANFDDPEAGVDRARYKKFASLYFLGLALHTIQDAFSGAHILRSNDNPRIIEKVCHYNKEIIDGNTHPNLCQHGVPFDSRDIIWIENPIGLLTPTRFMTGAITRMINRIDSGMKNITPEGRGAIIASASYLITFAKILDQLPGPRGQLKFDYNKAGEREKQIINEALNHFFEFSGDPGDDPMLQGSGFFNCKDNVIETI